MNDTPKHSPEYQARLDNFIIAVDLLGGQRSVACILDVSDRTVRDLVAGRKHIHDGFMRDITTALYDRERTCRELARQTDPLFAANRVPPPPRGGASHKREKADG
jgi:hypothetical protein